jgi:hypothetical protein
VGPPSRVLPSHFRLVSGAGAATPFSIYIGAPALINLAHQRAFPNNVLTFETPLYLSSPRHDIKRPNDSAINIKTPLDSIIPSLDDIHDYLNTAAA